MKLAFATTVAAFGGGALPALAWRHADATVGWFASIACGLGVLLCLAFAFTDALAGFVRGGRRARIVAAFAVVVMLGGTYGGCALGCNAGGRGAPPVSF